MKKTYIAILVASLMTVGGGGGRTPKPFHIMTTTQANLALLVIVLAMGTPLLSMAIINMGLLVKITM